MSIEVVLPKAIHHLAPDYIGFVKAGNNLCFPVKEPARAEVLFFEDDVQIRRLLRIILEAAGYAVREAEGGQPPRGQNGCC